MKGSTIEAFSWLNREAIIAYGFTIKEVYDAFKVLWNKGEIKGEWELWRREWFRDKPWYDKAVFIRSAQHDFTVYRGEWEKKDRCLGYEYKIPTRSGRATIKVLKKLMTSKFHWFGGFTWEIYGTDEFYLKTSAGALYCPVSALLDENWTDIQERMESYFKGYTDNPDTFKQLCTDVLESPEANQLKQIFTEGGINET